MVLLIHEADKIRFFAAYSYFLLSAYNISKFEWKYSDRFFYLCICKS